MDPESARELKIDKASPVEVVEHVLDALEQDKDEVLTRERGPSSAAS